MNSRIRSLRTTPLLALLAACSHRHPATGPTVSNVAPLIQASGQAVAAAPTPPPTTELLMLNGGGSPYINYQSHLLHLQSLRDLVLRAGISPDRLSVLASDGSDPAPDLATRDAQPEPDFWRLEGTRLEHRLDMPTKTIDSKLEGVTLAPATKASLTAWFDAAGKRLHPGDTLVLYVTDHGTRHGEDPMNNRITLWGNGEDAAISVRELAALVEKLDPGVKVVSLMSQCFSGGFAALSSARTRDGEPSGNVCGYFSSTADRRAYGCYAENRGKANVGHSFEFIRALEQSGSFRQAHDAVLATDDTPDVPLRSSDAYLESVVRRDAEARHAALAARADELLREAFLDPGAWQTETRQLDRVAQATGSFSPRSLGELEDLSKRLPETDSHLTSVSRAWREALGDANGSNLDRLIAARPDWAARLAEPAFAKLDADGTRALTALLLHDLAELANHDAAQGKRLLALKTRGDASEAASYRMQVRLAAVLRMRALLLSIAGRELLLHGGTPAQKASFAALTACEDLAWPKVAGSSPAETAQPAREPAAAPYPPFEEDMKLTSGALPGWMGISFKEPGEDLRAKAHLPAGASLVSLVFPDSPAKTAGFEIGDVVLGPPGAPFDGKNQIRQWTMLSEIGKPGKLEILRSGARRQIAITPLPYPMKWPALPGPTAVGSAAPKLDLKPYRGAVAADVKKNTKHVLYFWATWCGPCKAALPELLAFEKERHIPVVAVTDEDPKVLDAFFKKWSSPFPSAVGVDEFRRSFVTYGVSGTPTFVLVDEKGNVAAHQVGYDPSAGLGLPGWTWSGRKAPGAKP